MYLKSIYLHFEQEETGGNPLGGPKQRWILGSRWSRRPHQRRDTRELPPLLAPCPPNDVLQHNKRTLFADSSLGSNVLRWETADDTPTASSNASRQSIDRRPIVSFLRRNRPPLFILCQAMEKLSTPNASSKGLLDATKIRESPSERCLRTATRLQK